ncbi:hypothetical protein LGR54_21355 [Ancylobacter sp. Lp-2]|uniref:hypothetical protein n=1 Tax=Ancylobacter sp. Lp-2 TaxID=2881339 RepID=UPI001E447CD6|nr:hypothetical protein [Ancylobacter sp. Lp-2]MCB4771162.1 hypothetical protein [Ancylobacter sp. Lp-2]
MDSERAVPGMSISTRWRRPWSLRPASRGTRHDGRGHRCGLAAVLLVAALFGGGTGPARAQDAGEVNATLDALFGGHEPYQAFFEKLKKAVAADDRAAVAGMVDYPLRTKIDGKTTTVRNAKAFVASYDKIVTPKVRQAVAAQGYASLFANWRGVMIGNGEVWFTGIGNKGRIAVSAINN